MFDEYTEYYCPECGRTYSRYDYLSGTRSCNHGTGSIAPGTWTRLRRTFIRPGLLDEIAANYRRDHNRAR